ncbi:hypothetical protein, partial [Actibacterium sp.]|uniref:hypothetical protein n=1 Tax=Actibacterium sp. TaxID=1872125 RepID=UPI0035656032
VPLNNLRSIAPSAVPRPNRAISAAGEGGSKDNSHSPQALFSKLTRKIPKIPRNGFIYRHFAALRQGKIRHFRAL